MKAVTDTLKEVEFNEGDFLFEEGDLTFHFFIIQRGEVDVFLTDKKSREEIPVATIGPHQPVGEFALVTRKARSASARAKTKVSAIMVSEEAYKYLLQELPAWAIAVIESLIERLRETDDALRKHKSDNAMALKMISQVLTNKA